MLRLFHLLAGTTVTAMLMQDARKEGEGSSGVSVDDREVERVQRVLHQHANETVSFVCWWRTRFLESVVRCSCWFLKKILKLRNRRVPKHGGSRSSLPFFPERTAHPPSSAHRQPTTPSPAAITLEIKADGNIAQETGNELQRIAESGGDASHAESGSGGGRFSFF